jgi:hypothetical protein
MMQIRKPSRYMLVAGSAATLILVSVAWWRGYTQRSDANVASTRPSAILPKGPPSKFFVPRAIGESLRESPRPLISNLQITDLDRDGLLDVLVCDVVRNQVTWIRQFPAGTHTEVPVGGSVPAPAHVEAVDFDDDGDLDLVVASLGVLFPNNNRIGAVLILENDAHQHFTNHVVAKNIARVADVRAADLDGDGDLDLAVAGFGYNEGETSWLENQGGWRFEQHLLLRLSGPINTIVADVNSDGYPDIVALVSQEWEEIWAFLNDGRGHFTSRIIWGATNPDFGSSWITVEDLDQDGDPDIVHSSGDAFDYAPGSLRPWHGVQWLENKGNLQFEFHRIADLPGASSPQVADVDGDGDIDVVVVSAYNNWKDPEAASLVWLENSGRMQFTMHDIASSPTHLITVAIGDLNDDGKPDLVTGGMHISGPYDRISRVTAWSNRGR